MASKNKSKPKQTPKPAATVVEPTVETPVIENTVETIEEVTEVTEVIESTDTVEPETPVEAVEEVAEEVEEVVEVDPEFEHVQLYGNTMNIPWPSDPYGFTTNFKTAFTSTVSRLAGDPHKKEILDEAIRVALLHLDVKYKRDNAEREALLAQAAE